MTTVKYDKIGTDYNDTRTADPYLCKRMYQLLNPTKDGKYLDIGCGTGNYTTAISEKGISLCGVDPSEKMLSTARERSNEIEWTHGHSDSIPYPEKYFNGALASLTLHHWTDISKGFAELNRVVKADGSLVIFTSSPHQMIGYWLNHYFPKMLNDSIVQMPDPSFIKEELSNNGWTSVLEEKYFVKRDLQDLFLYAGKHRPLLYLDSVVRKGISSFADLGNQDEIIAGLLAIESDIQSGKIHEIIQEYENDMGDYLFISAKAKA